MATPVSPCPYSVKPHTNAGGTVSWRVSGSWNGKRVRENYPVKADADARCNHLNATANEAEAPVRMRLVQTRLSDLELAAAESGIDRIAGRWALGRVIDAGLDALAASPESKPVAPLLAEWLKLVAKEVDERWLKDLRTRNGAFLAAHPEITTDRFDSVLVRTWLDGLDVGSQSRANYRNAIHRFGSWLIERGYLKENPGAGIRISKKKSAADKAVMPSVFSAKQAEAYLRACETPDCRRLKGWAVLCLLCGLRPESEAERLEWAEIKFKSGELSVMGRKRGAKPRIIKLQPLALEWLKAVKKDGEEKPGQYWVHLRRRAVEIANEALAEDHPKEPPIVWDEDIQRHTYASMRAGQGLPMHDLAGELGNSTDMIYAHYRNPRPAAEVKAFWGIKPVT